jgi:S-layer protein (TIGR01567 family)
MKRFTTIALVALLAIAALIVPAAAQMDAIEVRSEVYTNESLDADNVTINATNFAGFWYDLDEGLSSETLTILNSFVDGRAIDEGGVVYNSTIVQTLYEGSFDSENETIADAEFPDRYPVMGFFAEKYVSLDDDSGDELVKLLLDNDDKYTLRTGSALELPNGYELTAKQIDVEGNKVWMELSKDGEFIEDEVITMPDSGGQTWTYDADVGDTDDVIVFRAHVTDVFQGQVDSLAVVEGLYLIDYQDVLEIESGDEFGELEVDSTGESIIMTSTGTITLSKGDNVDIAEGMQFNVADADQLRFYLMKEYTEPGTYEVRGSVAEEGDVWTPTNFAGFFYDIDDAVGTEELVVTGVSTSSRGIEEGDLQYNTSIQQILYEGSFDSETETIADSEFPDRYPVIGFFAEKYVSLDDDSADELVRLLLDNDDKYTLRTGSALELPNGYELTAKQIDVEGDKVWMELSKDGEFIEDEVISMPTSGNAGATWTYDADVGDTDDVIVFRAHITDVFQGQVDSLAVVEGLYLIDYQDILEIESGDEFGELEVDSASGGAINMSSTGTVTLSKGDTVDIAENMKFEVADSDSLRYYPFVELTIEGEETTQPDEDDEIDDEEPVTDNETEGNETVEPPVDETPDTEEPPVEDEGNETTDEEPAPGFEAIFAVAGLLAVAYLVRRN